MPGFVATAFRGYYNRHWPKNLPPRCSRRRPPTSSRTAATRTGSAATRPAAATTTSAASARSRTRRAGSAPPTTATPAPAPPSPPSPPAGSSHTGCSGCVRSAGGRPGRGSGQWGNPDDLGGGPLAPALGSATLGDGRQLLFALRFAALDGRGGPNRREVVLLEQRSPGGEFMAWKGLGNPERDDDRGRRIGVPVAVAAPDGRVHLFVRNADKGISTRVRDTDGRWDRWRDLGGAEIQDGLSTVVDGAGRVHVFGAGRETVHHWTQDTMGLPLTFRPGGDLPAPGDPLAAAADRGRRHRAALPQAAGAAVTGRTPRRRTGQAAQGGLRRLRPPQRGRGSRRSGAARQGHPRTASNSATTEGF